MPTPQQDVRKRSGYVTVLYVVLGLAAFFLIIAIAGVWVFVHSETGQKIMATVGKGMTLVQQASRAPGTKELREHGCSQAMVMPFDQIAEIFRGMSADADRALDQEIDRAKLTGGGTLVFCQVTNNDTPLACPDVARVYADAVADAPAQFGVSVQGRSKAHCEGIYTHDGTLVGPLNTRGRNKDRDVIAVPSTDQAPIESDRR
jgi:hypothetical protein